MRMSKEKIESFRKLRDKSGSRFYEFSTSWWAMSFFICIVGGCVLWNEFIPVASLKFDPYPFNGLRTVLALIGAIQAPVLLLYSRKSTDYRKKLLEQDYELEKKIYKKIEFIEAELKENRQLYLQELKNVQILSKKIRQKKRKLRELEKSVIAKKDYVASVESKTREGLQSQKSENNEKNITA
ncbi:DUF1003 domain-containing protein [Silvanigrella aquatica]|uniref:DUF1003 domain-containing protein n=1 Tax=Silvanigrella aquatica TaxID=1915309 RepID=A0A1L4CX96_9BACT|nr:DUF1003 domain-containing protein [Silvanigrella aquatica]APJ02571.1 hypothetical protein AXG55_00930 [Silvanigrella aquatica]